MSTPLLRIRRGAAFLGVVFVCAIGLRAYVTENETLLESIYWFVITVSTIGSTDGVHINVPPAQQIVTLLVIIFGMTATFYTIGGLLQLMIDGEIQKALGIRRMTHEISQLKDHVIVCGYGRIGRELVIELSKTDLKFVVVDSKPEKVAIATERGYLAFQGDSTEERVLTDVGIERAKSLVTALGSDSDNVFLTLTARNLNPDFEIIARGEHPETEKKLRQAGASRVVLPTVIGARKIATLLTRPHTADLLDKVIDSSTLDVDIQEIETSAASPAIGKTIRDLLAGRKFNLLIVAIRSSDGSMTFNPKADHEILAGDMLITIGPFNDVQSFKKEHGF